MSNITKEEAQKLYESGNASFKEIALRCYPELEHRELTIDDFGVLNRPFWLKIGHTNIGSGGPCRLTSKDLNIYPTRELAELCGQIIPQLTLWRDKYNGCELKELKGQGLWLMDKKLSTYYTRFYHAFSFTLAFKSEEIANQFVKDHKTLITRYYELLYV